MRENNIYPSLDSSRDCLKNIAPMYNMGIWVMEFSSGGYKIRKNFALENRLSRYS